MGRSIRCATFRQQLYHFQADELSEAERSLCFRHLEECGDCARLLEIEDGFARALRSRLHRDTAPPELVGRVRAALAKETGPFPPARWYRRPWVAAVAASVVLALLLYPGLSDWFPRGPASGGLPVERVVTLVDLACDRAGRDLSAQRRCTNPRHMNALKIGPRSYWNLSLADGPGRELVTDRSLRGHSLRVEGTYHPGIETLHLSGYEDLGPEGRGRQVARVSPPRIPAAL